MAQEFNPAEQRSNLRANVPTKLQDAYDRIVGAGMKFMFSKDTRDTAMQFLQQEGPMDEKLSGGIAYLMMHLLKQSNGTMPQVLIIPAGIDLILQAAEFSQKTGTGEVTTELIASAMQKYVFLIAKKAGVNEEQLMGGVEKIGKKAQQMKQGA